VWTRASQVNGFLTDDRIHVFQDLQPYICTFDGCCDALTTFPTRKLWAEHEFSEHRVDRFLKCHCGQTFTHKETFAHHLKYEHLLKLHHSQLLTQIAAAEVATPQDIHIQQCPLCLQDGWDSRRQFTTHVGRHLEQIALACLPRDVESDSEARSQQPGSSSPLHTSMRNQVPSVSAKSQAESESAMQCRLGESTAIDTTNLPPQALRAQIKSFDHEVPQSLTTANDIPLPTTHLYVPTGHSPADQGLWTDRSATRSDGSAGDSLPEALPNSYAQRSPSDIYSTMNLNLENMRLEKDHDAPHLQDQVRQLLSEYQAHATFSNGEMAPSTTTDQHYQYHENGNTYGSKECYSEHAALPFHPAASQGTLPGHFQSQDPKLFGEYASGSLYPHQNYIEIMNGRSPQYIDPGTYNESTSQIPNPMNTTLQFAPHRGQSQSLSEIGPNQYSNSNLNSEGDLFDSTQPAVVPNHYIQRHGEIEALGDINGPCHGSALPDPLQALSPTNVTKVPGSGRKVKRRRVMREQRTAEGAPKGPCRSGMRAAEAPLAASPPSPTSQRDERSHSRASQGSKEADVPNLSAYRSIISKKYLAEGKTLNEVIGFLKGVHNVVAR
jgi:hypothetical protein